jgi:hypothetical protein
MLNTDCLTVGSITAMKLYNTLIAQYDADDKSIVLFTGGYYTVTTKRRMNQFAKRLNLGFIVKSVKGEWVTEVNDKQIPFDDHGWCEFSLTGV